MRYVRSFALALALALLVLPAAPLGGIVPIPTVGGEAFALTPSSCAVTWLSSASSGRSHPGCTSPSEYNTNPPGDDYGTPAPPGNSDDLCAAMVMAAGIAWQLVRVTPPPYKAAALAAALAADATVLMYC